jgi:HPr kinase/phosphorylase
MLIHASCVSYEGRAVLLMGASGSGKSGLALELMALGCALVADDSTEVRRDGALLRARSAQATRGMIEARGVGLLTAEFETDVPIAFAVDLDRIEKERLPVVHGVDLLGVRLISLHNVPARHFPAAVFQMLKQGRSEPT